MKDEAVSAYLNRIGFPDREGSLAPSYELLQELQNRHMLTIPFEDLDIPARRITLDPEHIFEKVVRSRRGGFCYELNGLFHALLTALGYKVEMLSAAVFNHATQRFGPEFDHLALLVHLDKNYLVDVGFGDSFRNPIALPDGEQEDVSGRYRIFQIDGTTFELQKLEQEWNPQYRFMIVPRMFTDFNKMCEFQQDDPSSHFRSRMLCTIATPCGRITLSNNSVTLTEGKDKVRIPVNSPKEFGMQLKKYFDIVLPWL